MMPISYIRMWYLFKLLLEIVGILFAAKPEDVFSAILPNNMGIWILCQRNLHHSLFNVFTVLEC